MPPSMDCIIQYDTKVIIERNKTLCVGYHFSNKNAFGIQRIMFVFIWNRNCTIHEKEYIITIQKIQSIYRFTKSLKNI